MDLPTLRAHLELLRSSCQDLRVAEERWEVLREYVQEVVLTSADRAMTATILLHPADGLFQALDTTLRCYGKSGKQMHSQMLGFVCKLIEELGPSDGAVHAGFLVGKCVHFFKRFELSSVKCHTLDPVLVVLGWEQQVVSNLSLDPCGMAMAYQKEFAVNKKLTDTTKGGLLQVLGRILEVFPGEFHEGVQFNCQWLQDECRRILELSKDGSVSDVCIAGALSGLAATLEHEDGRGHGAPQVAYKHIMKTIPPEKVKATNRFLGVKSALKVLRQCSSEFSHDLTKDALGILRHLKYLCTEHSNKAVRKAADHALSAVFAQISKELASMGQGSDMFDPLHTTSQLLGWLGNMVSKQGASNHVVRFAIKGIGYLACPYKRFHGQKAVEKLLEYMTPHVDAGRILETVEDLADGTVAADTILLTSLGSIVNSLEIVDQGCTDMCEKVAARLIGCYLQLWSSEQMSVHSSIMLLLLSLENHPVALHSMTQFLVNLILTHTLRPVEGEILTGPLSQQTPQYIAKTAWSHYLKFWFSILKGTDLNEEAQGRLKIHPQLGARSSIQTGVYNFLMHSILDGLRNLEIGYEAIKDGDNAAAGVFGDEMKGGPDETQVFAAEAGSGLRALNEEDMLAFITLSDFSCAIIRDCGPACFASWSQSVIGELIAGSTRHPLLPGFYKLLKEAVVLCQKVGMFDADPHFAEDSLQNHLPNDHVRRLCASVLQEFLLEVLVACRRYSGDLLHACLSLLLTSPSSLLPRHQLCTPLKLALSLGLQHADVAHEAVNSLEELENSGEATPQFMLNEILPLLAPYLEDITSAPDRKALKKSKELMMAPNEDFEAIQRRIMLWIGRQGGRVSTIISQTNDASSWHLGSRWDSENKIGIKIGFPGMQPTSKIWLDAVLPQAAILAETSANRSCRVSACELLHSAIVWMIGMNASKPASRKDEDFQAVPTRFHKILRNLMPVAMRLAVSAEPVAKQLFEPLVFTLIHWLTRSARREAAETICLLDAIMEGLGNETSGALRDLCARASADFLKWSAKHIPARGGKGLHGNNLNSGSLLKRLFDRLSHPDPYKRLGAALAMGYCARILRSEEDLMEEYVLEALHYCVHALHLAEGDAVGSGTLKQTCHAINALFHHCVRKSSGNLMKENLNRIGFSSLETFLRYLWDNTRSVEASCRRRCMLLHEKLCEEQFPPEERDIDGGASGHWWKQYSSATGLSTQMLLAEFGNLNVDLSDSDSSHLAISRLRLWLQSLAAALEWATWVIEQGIVSESDIRAFGAAHGSNSMIVSLSQFLDFIPDVLGLPPQEWVHTSPELTGCDKEARDIVIAAIDLLVHIECGSLSLEPAQISKLLIVGLFTPGLIGLRPSDESLYRSISIRAQGIVRHKLLSPTPFMQSARSNLNSFVNHAVSYSTSSDAATQDDWLNLGAVGAAAFYNGVSLLLGIQLPGVTISVLSLDSALELPSQCLETAVRLVAEGNMSQIRKQGAEGCLSLSIQLGLPVTKLLTVLLESELASDFYQTFPSVVHRWIVFNAEECCQKLCSALWEQDQGAIHAERIIIGVFECLMHSTKEFRESDPISCRFKDAFLDNFGPYLTRISSETSPQKSKRMVRILKRLSAGHGSFLKSHRHFPSLVQSISVLMSLETSKDVGIRIHTLQMLPAILDSEETSKGILEAVESVVIQRFPSVSSQLRRGSTEAREYTMQLKELLITCVDAAKNNNPGLVIKILEAILPVIQELGNPEGHLYQDEVETMLALLAASPWAQGESDLLHPSKAVTVRMLVDYCWEIVHERKQLSGALKQAVCKFLLLPLLEFATSDLRQEFYKAKILVIIDEIEKGRDMMDIGGNDGSNLISQLCGLTVLELMYRVVEKDVLEEHVLSQLPKKNQTVMKLCASLAKDTAPISESQEVNEMQRKVCCAAFCVCSSLLVCTQSNPKFFSAALQGPKKGGAPSQLWRNMMAINQSLTFSVESSEELSKNQLARASTALSKLSQYSKGNSRELYRPGGLANSLTSTQSSLSAKISSSQLSLGLEEDVPVGDRSRSKEADTGEQEKLATPKKTSMSMSPTTLDIWGGLSIPISGKKGSNQIVSGELLFCEDELDKHESMLALVNMLERAGELPCSDSKDLPVWQILSSLQSPIVHRYAKLFLCKAIIHVETRDMERQMRKNNGRLPGGDSKTGSTSFSEPWEFEMDIDYEGGSLVTKHDITQESHSIFSRFATHFFPATLDVVMDAPARSSAGGVGTFHYLLRDMCLVWLRWSMLFQREPTTGLLKHISEIEGSAMTLLRHLVLVGYSSSADVVRVNHDYIRAFVAQWSADIPLPLDAVVSHIHALGDTDKNQEVGSKQGLFGLKLIVLALEHGRGNVITEGRYAGHLWKALIMVLQQSRPGARLSSKAGQAAGLFTKALSESPAVAKKEVSIEQVESDLRDGLQILFRKHLYGTLLLFLDGMASFYPKVVEISKAWLLNAIMKVDGKQRTMALKLLRLQASHMPDIFHDIARDELLGPLLHSNFPGVSHAYVALLKDLLPFQTHKHSEKVVNSVVQAYVQHPNPELQLGLFEFLKDAWQKWPEESRTFLQGPLLLLLSSDDPTVQNELVKFWHDVLPSSLPLRLQELLSLSIDPGAPWIDAIQGQWPQMASALLMELPKSLPAYNEALFDTSLAECKFMDYSINTWQGPSSSTLFTMGTASYSQDTWSQSSSGESSAGMNRNMPVFTQASPNKIRATAAITLTPTSNLSMGMNVNEDPSLSTTPSPPKPQRAHLRRRVYKQSGAEIGIAAALRRQAAEKRRVEERRAKVQLYRSYRTGELPDIQGVKISGFVAPMGQMVKKNTTAACMLISAIAQLICEEVENEHLDRQVLQGIYEQVSRCLSSSSHHSGYVQCLAGIVAVGPGYWIPPQSLVSSAHSSSEYQAMAFLLEKQMVSSPQASQTTFKSMGVVCPVIRDDEEAWRCLAELYQDIGKGDWLRNIRMGYLMECPDSRNALLAVQSGRPKQGLELYESLLEAYEEARMQGVEMLPGVLNAADSEANIWYEDKMECLEKLGHWDVLHGQVALELGGHERRQEEDLEKLVTVHKEDAHLNRYLRPFVQSCLFQKQQHDVFQHLLGPLQGDKEKMDVLYTSVPAELSCFQAIQLEWDASLADLRASMQSFRRKWSVTNLESSDARRQLLGLLQPIAETHEVVDCVMRSRREDGSFCVQESMVRKIVGKWSLRHPLSTNVWQDRSLSTNELREAMIKALTGILDKRSMHLSSRAFLHEMCSLLKLKAARRCLDIGSLDVAEELLEEQQLQSIGIRPSAGAQLTHLLTRVELYVAQIQQADKASVSQYELLQTDLQELMKYEMHGMEDIQLRARRLAACGEGLYLIGLEPGICPAEKRRRGKLCFQQWTGVVELMGSNSGKEHARACLRFALLCDSIGQGEKGAEGDEKGGSRQQELFEDVRSEVIQRGGYTAISTKNLLRSMSLGLSDANLYLPRIFTSLLQDEPSRKVFEKDWRSIPVLVLLPWISQMFNQIETDAGEVLAPCIFEIAAQYPQQVYFPFQLCRAHLGEVGKRRTQAMGEKLNIPILKGFSDALHKVTYPVQRWDGYEALIYKALQAGQREAAVGIYRDEAVVDLFGSVNEKSSRSGEGRNDINSKFAREYRSKFSGAFGADGKLLCSMQAEEFKKKSRAVISKAKEELGNCKGKCELSLFTSWFSDFTTMFSSGTSGGGGGGNEQPLYVPKMASVGLCDGVNDVKIVGFGKMVNVFSSKQKPKMLTIYAEDFTSYNYIVKGGEELRIDQRVEQLFSVMNGLVTQASSVAVRDLVVCTYDVIPLSPTLGLLAFVDGTRPLENVMVPATVSEMAYRRATEGFQKHINVGIGGYNGIFKRADHEFVVPSFEKIESAIPWNGLREALIRYAGSMEGFMRFRENFLRSLAVYSIMGYLAGVGDRHLQNSLVKDTSGELVPIDFGYSFGTATQVLLIPELMPFRMTRQLLGVFFPHDGKEILSVPMIRVMEVLRHGKLVIEGVMQAFLEEPLLDWQREALLLARLKGKKGAEQSLEHHEERHAHLKVEFSRQKLCGRHPVDVMLNELSGRHGQKPYWRVMERIVRGNPSRCLRARISGGPECVLSTEDQVHCLLDQATDKNILARTWWGWRPWM